MIDINNIIKKYIELYPCDRKSIFGASKNLPVLNKDNEKNVIKIKWIITLNFNNVFV